MALPQLKLDTETVEMIAASKVRAAMAGYVNGPTGVSELISALHAEGKLDEQTCTYILLHESRFTLCPAPVFFQARWVLEVEHHEKFVCGTQAPTTQP